MAHPAYTAIMEGMRAAALARDTEGNANGDTAEYRRLSAAWCNLHDLSLVTCPTCGGSRTRREGARGHHCIVCTRKAESLY